MILSVRTAKKFFGIFVFLLCFLSSLLGVSQEENRDSLESERKCAQNAVYAVSKMLGHDVDWTQIDTEFGGAGNISFASIREFFQRRGGFCHSVRFQEHNLRQIDSFLVSPKQTGAIGVILSADVIRLKITMEYLGTGTKKSFVESLSIFLPGNPHREFVVQLFGEFGTFEPN